MKTIRFDLSQEGAPFKILNATNGGPWHKRHVNDQYHSNFEDYKAARIPYARNHDSSFCSVYGGAYAHDISRIFPDFNADPEDPASYDFACTDEAIEIALDAGTRTFFRLGQAIEHEVKKHGTIPPADFEKWANICEHIVRHYTGDWADGLNLEMPYWEIWNEPDLDPDDSPNKRCWGGTREQFFDLFEITAKRLKNAFPDLKIGGPALAGNEEWAEAFLTEMSRREVPIDFFSWHIYTTEPLELAAKSVRIRALLDSHGYNNTESILNEWNYVRGWTDDFIYSLKAIHGMKGAAFTMACISLAQAAPIDMLMYYDTRPSTFNGAFDMYTCEPLKGYYPLAWYGQFYDLEHEVRALNELPDIYTLCGVDAEGCVTMIVTYYTENDKAKPKRFAIDLGQDAEYEVYMLDEKRDAELTGPVNHLRFTMNPNTCMLIREVPEEYDEEEDEETEE